MIRRLGAALIGAALLLPVLAVPVVVAAAPSQGNCVLSVLEGNPPNQWGLYNQTISHTNLAWAARADLYVDADRFRPCNNPAPLTGNSSVSQWVALTGAGAAASFPDIVQVGIIKCGTDDGYNSPDSACYGSRQGTLRYFYAWGNRNGCNGYTAHNPRALDLGPAGTTKRYENFQVIHNVAGGRIEFWIDGVKKADISDLRMRCWLGGIGWDAEPNVTWSSETWDDGDGVGGGASGTVLPHHYDNMRYSQGQFVGGSGAANWIPDVTAYSPYVPSGVCSTSLDSGWGCSRFSSDHIGIYADRP